MFRKLDSLRKADGPTNGPFPLKDDVFLGLQRNSRNSMPRLIISGPRTADAPETIAFH